MKIYVVMFENNVDLSDADVHSDAVAANGVVIIKGTTKLFSLGPFHREKKEREKKKKKTNNDKNIEKKINRKIKKIKNKIKQMKKYPPSAADTCPPTRLTPPRGLRERIVRCMKILSSLNTTSNDGRTTR